MFLLNIFLISTLGYLILSDLFMGNPFYKIAFFLLVVVYSNLERLIKREEIKTFLYLGLGLFCLWYPLMANIALLLGYAHIKSLKNRGGKKWNQNILILALISCYALYSDVAIGKELWELKSFDMQFEARKMPFFHSGWRISLCIFIEGVLSMLYSHYEEEYLENKRDVYRTLDENESFKLSMQARWKELNDKNKADIYNEILSERNRIAKEIHDKVGHRISSAIFKVGAISTLNQDEVIGELVEDLEESLNLAMNDIKASIYDIYDDVGDLRSYLQKMICDFHFCRVNLDMNVDDLENSELKLVIISIIKEALSNVIKHSDATFVNIKLGMEQERLKLLIVDNGRQYVQREEGILTEHLGLRGMKENIEHFGGRFRYVFQNGFRIYISIPVKK